MEPSAMKDLSLIGISVLGLLASSCSPPESESTTDTNPARDLVMESIEAHGGKERWYDNGQLQFQWTYHMSDKGPEAIVDTVQTVDVTTLDVAHEVVGKDITFGISGGESWIRPADAEFSPPHQFWALTPFYFIGIPFVFNDENAIFERLDEPMTFEGKDYTQVKITYTEEAGDSPDDYYVLLIDPETKLTRGAYYIVTSKLVAPNGPGPEKFLTLDELQDVDGVKLASGHRTFKMEDGKIGEQMRFTEVSGVKFLSKGTVDLGIPE